jgi:[calcium/calmodulin-dependent protein kinase] kinase
MGVTLYCLRYGKLPFEKQSIFELYDSIRGDSPVCEDEADEKFKDLMGRILEKDPEKRIDMFGLRVSDLSRTLFANADQMYRNTLG